MVHFTHVNVQLKAGVWIFNVVLDIYDHNININGIRLPGFRVLFGKLQIKVELKKSHSTRFFQNGNNKYQS